MSGGFLPKSEIAQQIRKEKKRPKISIVSLQDRREKLNVCALPTDSKDQDFLACAFRNTAICSRIVCVRNRG